MRFLLKHPGFSLVAVLTLALGIGANTAVFSLINAFLLKPVGGRNPEQLVGLYSENTTRPGDFRGFSYPNFIDLRTQSEVFEDLYAFSLQEVGVREGETTRRVSALNVSSSFFTVFGTPVAIGRDFVPADDTAPSPVVIVSHDWCQRHGASPDLVGQSITVNGRPHTIIGVAAREFTGTVPVSPADLYFPLSFGADGGARLARRDRHDFMVVGRLKPDLDLPEANARLAVVSERLAMAYPAENRDQRLQVARLPRLGISTAPHDDRTVLRALSTLAQGMAGAVLLIACLNLANLLLARGVARRREVSIRVALGARRIDLVRQMLGEGALLAVLGAALGLVLATGLSGVLISSLKTLTATPLALDTRPDLRVLGATLLFGVLAVLFFALGPALKLSRSDVFADLKEQTVSSDGTRVGRLFSPRHLLVIGQVALSLVLLVAAGLFTRGAIQTMRIDPGFTLDRGLYLNLDASLLGYPESRTRQLYAAVLERIRELPEVESASLAATTPLGERSMGEAVQRAGSPQPPPLEARDPAEGQAFPAHLNVVSDGYFRSMEIPLLRGRDFESRESSDSGLPRVAIINEVLAAKLWPGEDAVGRSIQFGGMGATPAAAPESTEASAASGAAIQVVGVTRSFRMQLSDHDPMPMVFLPYGQARDHWSDLHLHVRARPGVDPAGLLRTVRNEVLRIDPALPILAARTLHQHLESNVQAWVIRAGAGLFAGLGVLAGVLAVLGIYGLKAHTVMLRTREIGIRMALGATRDAVLGMVVRDGSRLALAGLGVGLPLAVAVALALSRFLFEVRPLDPLVFGLAPLLLAVPALVACWLPARRASRVDPWVALRNE